MLQIPTGVSFLAPDRQALCCLFLLGVYFLTHDHQATAMLHRPRGVLALAPSQAHKLHTRRQRPCNPCILKYLPSADAGVVRGSAVPSGGGGGSVEEVDADLSPCQFTTSRSIQSSCSGVKGGSSRSSVTRDAETPATGADGEAMNPIPKDHSSNKKPKTPPLAKHMSTA